MFYIRSKQNGKKAARTGNGRSRGLVFEVLEDRRVMALPHAEGGFSQGLLHTEADFARMAQKIAEQADPWLSGYQALVNHGYAQPDANPRPLETVIRGGTGQNFNQMVIDIQRSYMLALRWKVTGNAVYADKAVEFLNAWQYTMTSLTGNADRFLAAGIYGYQWANVAEIMRTYDGWAPQDAQNFGNWLITHFYSLNKSFLYGVNGGQDHNGAAITNYWANWDLCNIASMLAIGVYTDRHDIYNEAIAYLYEGGGNGSIDRFVYHVHDGNLGQWQEAGRDQGHTTLGVSLAGPIMQMAWNQGLDLFSYDNNRLLAGSEYVAKYNAWQDVPFEQYSWGTGVNGTWQTHTSVSDFARGISRPGYELIYNHYANIKGIAAPWSEARVDAYSPEGYGGNGDEFGFGTLTYTLDPFPVANSKPSGLIAVNYDGTVKLNWWGALYANSHNVYRSTSADGPFELIAAGVADLMHYVDHGMAAGEYFYKVTGVVAGVETQASDVVRLSTAPELVARIEFNESNGTTAPDSSGNGVTGTLHNGASWTAGQSGNAVDLSGAGQYVSLPANVTEGLSDFTIATWVRLDSIATWTRIFDFGDSNGRYLFLTPQAGSGKVRFAIATNYSYNNDVIEGTTALPVNQWVHVAVTLSGTVGRLYVNGTAVGLNAQMYLNPFQVGGVSNNWIGRSQYPNDAYLDGRIDDFRIYNGALSAGAIFQMATGNPPPAVPATPAVLTATAVVGNQINLAWTGTSNPLQATYTVRRTVQDGGPYMTIATGVAGPQYIDTNVASNVVYYYVVTADNNGGSSPFSQQASAMALPPLPGAPGGLTASGSGSDKVKLTWTAGSNAATYDVKRALVDGGPYTTIASGVTATEFVDQGLVAGTTYYYVVSAANAAGTSTDSNQASAFPTHVRARWKLDESSGVSATDASGNGWTGTLFNGPTWTAARIENGVNLDGSNDYVSVPNGVVNGLTDFTISAWVSLDVSSTWMRVFDFGSGTNVNMFLTPKNGSGTVQFAITTSGGGNEQRILTGHVLQPGFWYHVAVTLSGGVGIVYVNGAEAGRNSSMTLTPSSLGATTQNYIGKSQYNDPYLDGRIDDFRIYNFALGATDVSQLYYVPLRLGDYDGDGLVAGGDFLAWQRQLGQSTLVYRDADGDGDGVVGAPDLDVWHRHYGVGSTPSVLAAPLIADEGLDEESDAIFDDELALEVVAASLSNETADDLASSPAENSVDAAFNAMWLRPRTLRESTLDDPLAVVRGAEAGYAASRPAVQPVESKRAGVENDDARLRPNRRIGVIAAASTKRGEDARALDLAWDRIGRGLGPAVEW
ncbi:MAG: alginate lyase family protein [Pirellulales bacterium]|nr:alginate lyase family protein [Pirellulales bacterium]